MAASIRITSHHTAGDDGSTTDVAGGSIYFQSTDTDAAGGSVAHNGAGTNYSDIKNIKLYVQSGPLHSVSNLKWYWTGTAVANIGVNGKVSITYTDPIANGTTALTGTTSMYTYTPTAPLSNDGSFVTGTDTAPKFIGNFLVLQVAVGNATVASNVALGSLVARYDEM